MAQHPHLIVPEGPDPVRFTSPSSGRSEALTLPARDRAQHAQNLITKLEAVAEIAQARADEQKAFGLDDGIGIYLTFQSEPNFDLKFESLDVARSGIELCALKTTPDNRTQATVFVPDGKLDLFLRKVVAYRDKMTKPRKEDGPTRPQNQDLVEGIAEIQLAALEALWTETDTPFPVPAAAGPVPMTHKIESVKIVHPQDHHDLTFMARSHKKAPTASKSIPIADVSFAWLFRLLTAGIEVGHRLGLQQSTLSQSVRPMKPAARFYCRAATPIQLNAIFIRTPT